MRRRAKASPNGGKSGCGRERERKQNRRRDIEITHGWLWQATKSCIRQNIARVLISMAFGAWHSLYLLLACSFVLRFFPPLLFSLTNKITIGNSNNITVMVMALWAWACWIIIAKNLLSVVQFSLCILLVFAFLPSFLYPFVTLTRRTLNFIIFLIIIVIVIQGIYEVMLSLFAKKQQLCSTFSMC